MLIVGLGTWILVAAATKAPAPTKVEAIVVTVSAQCGELLANGSGLQLKVGEEVVSLGGDAAVSVVRGCPK